jgi:hypothetical protein
MITPMTTGTRMTTRMITGTGTRMTTAIIITATTAISTTGAILRV